MELTTSRPAFVSAVEAQPPRHGARSLRYPSRTRYDITGSSANRNLRLQVITGVATDISHINTKSTVR